MSKGLRSLLAAAVLAATAFATSAYAQVPPDPPKGPGVVGRGTGPIVYVKSQGLYYDSIVLADLPFNGTDNWQLLEMDHPNMSVTALETEFGPGDVGYFGGRWWMDTTEPFGEMNEGDMFFLCPLLGPGYEVQM